MLPFYRHGHQDLSTGQVTLESDSQEVGMLCSRCGSVKLRLLNPAPQHGAASLTKCTLDGHLTHRTVPPLPADLRRLGLAGRLTHACAQSLVRLLEDDLWTPCAKPLSLIRGGEERSWEDISFLFCPTHASFHMCAVGYSRLW